MKNKFAIFGLLLFSLLLFGCVFPWSSRGQSGIDSNASIVVTQASPTDVTLAQGGSVLLKIDDQLVNVSMKQLGSTEALYSLSTQDNPTEEVTVLTDGTFTYVDLDNDASPNLKLRVKQLLASSTQLEVTKVAAILAGVKLAPKMCTEGFAKASSANIVFVLDKSRSMDYPVNQENYSDAPADLLEQIQILRQKFPVLASSLSDEDLGTYLGSGDCYDVPQSARVQCQEVQDAFDASRTILMGSDSLYDKYSKMGAAKRTASNVLSTIRSMQRLSKANVSVALVSFSGYAYTDEPLTTDFSLVQEGINRISTSSATNIGGALREAFTQFDQSSADNKIIVFLTDGRPSEGLTSSQIVAEYGDRFSTDKVVIHTIGLGLIEQEVDKNLLQTLATRSNGTYSFVSSGNELKTAFESALGVGNIKCG